jgi:hypothetical protein
MIVIAPIAAAAPAGAAPPTTPIAGRCTELADIGGA